MKTVRLFGREVVIKFALYKNNDTVAMTAYTLDDTPYARLTVNWEANWEGYNKYRNSFAFPAVVIKDYSENEGMFDELQAAGVISNCRAYMAGTNRGVKVAVIADEWIDIAKLQLNIQP